MAESQAATFEESLARLEEIVRLLEADSVSLDDSVKLFREGRELARRCETLLGAAQDEIDRAVGGNAPPAPAAIPARRTNGAAPAQPTLDSSLDDEISF